MKKITKVSGLLFLIFMAGCASLKQNKSQTDNTSRPVYSLNIGINHGGITENNDLSVVDNDLIEDIDSYTGATKIGANIGVHRYLPLRRNNIEIGVDYMFNNQVFSYKYLSTNSLSTRNIISSQILLPVTYNIGILRINPDEPLFNFKFGYIFQFNSFNIYDKSPDLPEYKVFNRSSGLTIGVSTIPFRLKNNAKIGFYLDLYRGSQVYEDAFNQRSFETPGSSYLKAGIIYQFKK